MKNLMAVILLLSSISVFADIFDKGTQECIVEQIHKQHESLFAETSIEEFIAFSYDELNWEALLLTKFKGLNQYSRSFLSLKDGNYEDTFLLVEGVMELSLDTSSCFL